MDKVYIFVDDERDQMFQKLKEHGRDKNIYCYHTKTYKKTVQLLSLLTASKAQIFIDLDHDLGMGKTGYDVAKYIVENQIPLVGFKIHSMNPVGVRNIRQLLTRYGYKEMKNGGY